MLFKISIFYTCIVINLSYYKNIVLLLSVFTSFHHSCYISLIRLLIGFLDNCRYIIIIIIIIIINISDMTAVKSAVT